MGELREIVEVGAVERLFIVLAFALPILGAGIGAAHGARRRAVRSGLLSGLVVGLLGPLNLALWRIYNALTDHNGLDTVRNLFINLALFLLVGIGIGAGVAWWQRRFPGEAPPVVSTSTSAIASDTTSVETAREARQKSG